MIEVLVDSPAHDGLGYHESDWAKNGEQLIMRTFLKDNMVVFDVGANVGQWLKYAICCANVTVHAFEPAEKVFQELLKNVGGVGGLQRVIPYRVALGNAVGLADFFVSTPKTAGQTDASHASSFYLSNVKQHPDVGYYKQEQTPMRTLDDCLMTHIDFLKIDTEGMELEVLKGAKNTLHNFAIDIVQFEYGSKYPAAFATLKEVYSLLDSYGFKIYRIIPTGLLYIPVWRDALECYRFSNYLALRKDKSLCSQFT